MDKFVTLDFMGTFIGMVTIVMLLTEFTKDAIDKIAKKIPTKYVVFFYSLIILFGYQATTGTLKSSHILLNVINSVVITMTAQGGYEWTCKPIEKKVSETITNIRNVRYIIKKIKGNSLKSDTEEKSKDKNG